MNNLGYFTAYIPTSADAIEDLDTLSALGVRFSKNEIGEDWYSFNKLTGRFVMVDGDGNVISTSTDITALFPHEASVYQLEEAEDLPERGMTLVGDAFTAASLTEADYEREIQSLLDTAAKARRYADGNAMATYGHSTNESWAAEANAFIAWRDAVWQYAYTQLDAVKAGDITPPALDAFLASLPTADWPEAN